MVKKRRGIYTCSGIVFSSEPGGNLAIYNRDASRELAPASPPTVSSPGVGARSSPAPSSRIPGGLGGCALQGTLEAALLPTHGGSVVKKYSLAPLGFSTILCMVLRGLFPSLGLWTRSSEHSKCSSLCHLHKFIQKRGRLSWKVTTQPNKRIIQKLDPETF